MQGIGLIILIVIGIAALFFVYKVLKPYFIKYDSTLFLTGGLGSGKTLTAVKTAIVNIRKQKNKWFWQKLLVEKIKNPIRKLKNKHRAKKGKEIKELYKIPEEPELYSNIPIYYTRHIFGHKKYSYRKLDILHLTLLKRLNEHSIVLIDELPQLVNQFNWNEKLVQNNINEFITFFRQYYDGLLIITAQSTSDIVAQIRRKGNEATWLYNFKKHFFGIFYSVQACDMMLSDEISTTSNTFIEDNTKKIYGIFPPKGTYSTRAYKNRVENFYIKPIKEKTPKKSLYTNEIIRVRQYDSPLDNETTEATKKAQMEQLIKESSKDYDRD